MANVSRREVLQYGLAMGAGFGATVGGGVAVRKVRAATESQRTYAEAVDRSSYAIRPLILAASDAQEATVREWMSDAIESFQATMRQATDGRRYRLAETAFTRLAIDEETLFRNPPDRIELINAIDNYAMQNMSPRRRPHEFVVGCVNVLGLGGSDGDEVFVGWTPTDPLTSGVRAALVGTALYQTDHVGKVMLHETGHLMNAKHPVGPPDDIMVPRIGPTAASPTMSAEGYAPISGTSRVDLRTNAYTTLGLDWEARFQRSYELAGGARLFGAPMHGPLLDEHGVRQEFERGLIGAVPGVPRLNVVSGDLFGRWQAASGVDGVGLPTGRARRSPSGEERQSFLHGELTGIGSVQDIALGPTRTLL